MANPARNTSSGKGTQGEIKRQEAMEMKNPVFSPAANRYTAKVPAATKKAVGFQMDSEGKVQVLCRVSKYEARTSTRCDLSIHFGMEKEENKGPAVIYISCPGRFELPSGPARLHFLHPAFPSGFFGGFPPCGG